MKYQFSAAMQDMKPSAIREIFKSLGQPGAISLAAGNPAPESFPSEQMAQIAADIFETRAATALQYGTTEGYTPLRELVAARLKTRFGIDTDQNMTVITSGGQQAIELACKTFCNAGDVVICENPSFIGALNAFRSLGACPVGVELEADGMSIDGLEAALKAHPNTKMIYVIPTFQNPAGLTTSLTKRRAIYALAQQYDVMILEDNPYGDLRFAGEDLPTLKSMDTDGRVIYCGTFSKILSAGMRVGFVCGNEQAIQKMVVAKQTEDVHTNLFFQMLCAEYMARYDLDAHIEGIRALYRDKCACMLDALDRYMPQSVQYTRPDGGLFLWCTLPESVSLSAFVAAASDNKVFVVPGTTFNCDLTAPSQSFRLNYSTPSKEQIEEGVRKLGAVLQEMV
ncbi:MAG: PLP-dependent aminotransferase family protein [Clostridia bacterium]|nr:PLP-dependent aminotransferase family protein [Clostridia bacterium]